MLEIMNYKQILVVIVLYKCNIDNSTAFISAVNAANKASIIPSFYIFDNTPGNKYHSQGKILNGFNVEYVFSDVNLGVSGAYNRAYEYAVDNDMNWIVLLDQDTHISSDYFSEFIKAKSKSDCLLFAPVLRDIQSSKILSPCNYILGRASHMKSAESGTYKLNNKSFLNSGLIVSTRLFELTGGYNEKLPMYFSDFNFIDRCRKYIDSYYLLNTTFCHSMSSNDKSDIDSFLPRFKMYMDGAMRCYDSAHMKFVMSIWVLLRAVKSSIQLRSSKPLSLYTEFIFHER